MKFILVIATLIGMTLFWLFLTGKDKKLKATHEIDKSAGHPLNF